MQKTYWWRIAVIFLPTLIIGTALKGKCNFSISRCLGGDSILFTRTLFHFSLSVFFIGLVIIFYSDIIFKKWLKFAIVWLILSGIFIAASPTYDRSTLGLNPTKESVSIWMSALFVFISLAQVIYLSNKNKKK